MEHKKNLLAWISLITLIILLLFLNYIKFFSQKNPNIEEKPVENSSSRAIETALSTIAENFNTNEELNTLKEENILLSATRKNYSLFITDIENENRTVYEFKYNNLKLSINVLDEKENLEKFNRVYKILIMSCQKRIQNEDIIDEKIEKFLNGEVEIEAIQKKKSGNIINYQMDITKKISSDNINNLNQNNN
mgnify:FL=1